MPHLTFEYTGNLAKLDLLPALKKLNLSLADSGEFEEADIKSRALRLDDFVVGTASADRSFVHVTVAILSGRSPAIKARLSHALLGVLKEIFRPLDAANLQLSVEIQDIDRDSYAKSFGA
jgi:5-carboxymethyl-2-hydroxymuconate isomerase